MMKVLSLFSGIGAFEKALTELGVKYKLVNYCEIDKYASKAYAAIHQVSESLNLGDITKVDETKLPKDLDLITYGFPCQDISIAGKQKGLFNADGSQTRSGLFFEALRIIESTKPAVAIAENVKALTSKKFKEQFKIVLDALEAAGYNNYYKVLNAKDFGVAQNRERVFIVSIRKDIDLWGFDFPTGWPLDKTLKDYLEDEVDEKYYLSDKLINFFTENSKKNKEKGNGFRFSPTNADHIAKIITTKSGSRMDDNFIIENEKTEDLEDNFSKKELKLSTKNKSVEETIKGKELKAGDFLDFYNRNVTKEGIAGTITTRINASTTSGVVVNEDYSAPSLRIRRLTPKECYRLMGFSDEDFTRAQAAPTSNTQLYKQAGNSIVVDVVREILRSLIEDAYVLDIEKAA